MINKYTLFIIGIVLGIAITVYIGINKVEKFEKIMKVEQKLYSTKKLNMTLEKIVQAIDEKIKENKRELTEEEKDEIIIKCYKEKFYI